MEPEAVIEAIAEMIFRPKFSKADFEAIEKMKIN